LALIRQARQEKGAALLAISHDREIHSQFESVQQFDQLAQLSEAGFSA